MPRGVVTCIALEGAYFAAAHHGASADSMRMIPFHPPERMFSESRMKSRAIAGSPSKWEVVTARTLGEGDQGGLFLGLKSLLRNEYFRLPCLEGYGTGLVERSCDRPGWLRYLCFPPRNVQNAEKFFIAESDRYKGGQRRGSSDRFRRTSSHGHGKVGFELYWRSRPFSALSLRGSFPRR